MSTQTATLTDFFNSLFPPHGQGLIELRALPSKSQGFFRRDDTPPINHFLHLHSSENVYFGVATRREPGGGSLANCVELHLLFCDIDFKNTSETEARSKLERFPLKPSIVVASGNGLHIYFLLKEPLDLQADAERARSLLRGLALALGGDLASAEPARILRVPGTLNHKYEPPRRVLVESFNPERRYNVCDLDDLLPPEPERDGGRAAFEIPERILDGSRNDTLYRLGRSLHTKKMSPEAILAALKIENLSRCDPPLPDGEVEAIAANAVGQPDRPTFQPSAADQANGGKGSPSDRGPYRIEHGRICREKFTKEGPIAEPLCNFTATVSEEIVLDDGAETARAFLITGRLDTGQDLPSARVPASRFAGMNWVTDSWGIAPVIRAGQSSRDYLREAIQRLSANVRCRQVFTHTGWRELDGSWVFLTSSGAIGRDGVEVDLGSELARYRLPLKAEDPVGAMRQSLRLLNVAQLTVTAPLWAAVYRAPLASAYPIDASLWLEAITGSLKSTIAGLFLCHFGDFDRTHLTGSWSSTANQLERRAFTLKDVLFVIDDYAPSALDARELEAKAARLIRSQGNLAGRGRLRADLSERPAFPPRGLIIATGEQHPPGQSLAARLLLIELERTQIDLAALTRAQTMSTQLRHALAGYIAWLAPQMRSLPALLRETFAGARARGTSDGEHLRVPEVLAHLWLGLHCGLSYAEDIGACTGAEADALRARCWDALLATGRAQGRLVEEERPSLRFLRVLHTLITQRRAVLLQRDQGPDEYRGEAPLIGWFDDDTLYLIPEAAFTVVSRCCRDAGEPFPVRESRLRADLCREGLSTPDPGRYTATVRVGGRPRRVLRLDREAVTALLGEEFVTPLPVVAAVAGSGG